MSLKMVFNLFAVVLVHYSHATRMLKRGSFNLTVHGVNACDKKFEGSSRVPPPQCYLKLDDYKASPDCLEELHDKWQQMGKLSTDGSECRFDKDTGKIVCEKSLQCGGVSKSVDAFCKRTARFHCGRDFGGAGKAFLQIPCCDTCKKLTLDQVGTPEAPVALIECEGCDKDSLDKLKEQNPQFCSRDPTNGEFKCDFNQAGETGKVDMEDESLECDETPCDECADDPAARAQCCSNCLQATCSTTEQFWSKKKSQFCRGCSQDDFEAFEHAQFMKKVKKGAIIGGSSVLGAAAVIGGTVFLVRRYRSSHGV